MCEEGGRDTVVNGYRIYSVYIELERFFFWELNPQNIWYSGQQVVEEIMDVQRPGCPPEFLFVPITETYESYRNANLVGKAMPMLRTRYDQSTGLSPNNPRQQVSHSAGCHF